MGVMARLEVTSNQAHAVHGSARGNLQMRSTDAARVGSDTSEWTAMTHLGSTGSEPHAAHGAALTVGNPQICPVAREGEPGGLRPGRGPPITAVGVALGAVPAESARDAQRYIVAPDLVLPCHGNVQLSLLHVLKLVKCHVCGYMQLPSDQGPRGRCF